jgi:hypothetical protein
MGRPGNLGTGPPTSSSPEGGLDFEKAAGNLCSMGHGRSRVGRRNRAAFLSGSHPVAVYSYEGDCAGRRSRPHRVFTGGGQQARVTRPASRRRPGEGGVHRAPADKPAASPSLRGQPLPGGALSRRPSRSPPRSRRTSRHLPRWAVPQSARGRCCQPSTRCSPPDWGRGKRARRCAWGRRPGSRSPLVRQGANLTRRGSPRTGRAACGGRRASAS